MTYIAKIEECPGGSLGVTENLEMLLMRPLPNTGDLVYNKHKVRWGFEVGQVTRIFQDVEATAAEY